MFNPRGPRPPPPQQQTTPQLAFQQHHPTSSPLQPPPQAGGMPMRGGPGGMRGMGTPTGGAMMQMGAMGQFPPHMMGPAGYFHHGGGPPPHLGMGPASGMPQPGPFAPPSAFLDPGGAGYLGGGAGGSGANPLVPPYPPPPLHYARNYSDEAVRERRCLPPPPVPSTRFVVYNEVQDLDAPLLPSLADLGIAQLYSPTGRWKEELKCLNRSVMASFMDLLNILIDCPSSPERIERMEMIRLFFINIHHLVNEYRPVQARATLREMISRQNEEIRQVRDKLQRCIEVGKEALGRIRSAVRELDYDWEKDLLPNNAEDET